MFRTAPATEPTRDVVDSPPADPIPLSVISLDLDTPAIGWTAYLTGRGIEVVTDDIGRPAIARADAKQLFDERREVRRVKLRCAKRRNRRRLRLISSFGQRCGVVCLDTSFPAVCRRRRRWEPRTVLLARGAGRRSWIFLTTPTVGRSSTPSPRMRSES